jgi:hypothetical protein
MDGLSPLMAAARATRLVRRTDKKVTKSAEGTTVEWDDNSELGQFVKCINQEQSATTGVGRWTVDGRLRALAKDLLDLADAANERLATKGAFENALKAEGYPAGPVCPACGQPAENEPMQARVAAWQAAQA